MQSSHRDPTTPSQTKYAYPFAKTKRFPQRNPICPEAFYSYDSQLSSRKTSLGYGRKTDFAKMLPQAPAATRYRIKSCFEEGQGVTFGCGRDKSPDRSYLVPQIHKNPGVGQYENQVVTRMPQEYSLHAKTIDVVEKSKTSNHTPGPGSYQTNDFENNTGKQSISKYGDSKFGTIEPNRKRFPLIKPSPGPAAYTNEQDGEVGSGHYTLSRHHGKGGRVFSRQARFTGQYWRASVNPGPSNYDVPTEFGHPAPLQQF